jgi:hypothetical protein
MAARHSRQQKNAKEMLMKRNIVARAFAITITSALGLASAPSARAADDKVCSNATLAGTFGYTITGVVLSAPPPLAGPFASVGRQSFDGKGHTSATAFASANGNPLQLFINGTYVVNPDCTGLFSIIISPLGTAPSPVYFVIDNDGQEIRAIAAGQGQVTTYIGKRQFPDSK